MSYCGTKQGWESHKAANEPPCKWCVKAVTAPAPVVREVRVPKPPEPKKPRQPRADNNAKCGTANRYRRHLRNGEDCEECRLAENARRAKYRKPKPRKPRQPIPPQERFWAKVNKTADCWEWAASKDRAGFGHFNWGDRMGRAHQFAYELHHGEVPAGMHAKQTCGNNSCVRPEHLEAVPRIRRNQWSKERTQ